MSLRRARQPQIGGRSWMRKLGRADGYLDPRGPCFAIPGRWSGHSSVWCGPALFSVASISSQES